MLTDNFLAILHKEGVASILSWADGEPHLAATWNSYITITPEQKLLVPVLGMQTTQNNVAVNNRIKMVIGSKEIVGLYGPGAGFLLEGTARFLHEGAEIAAAKERFPWAVCLMEITVNAITQTV